MQFWLSEQARLSVLIFLCALLWTLESVVPLYRYGKERPPHASPNVVPALLLVLTNLALSAGTVRLADFAGRNGVGLFRLLEFPPLMVLIFGVAALAVAFITGGLREIGGPSRKAMIMDFAQDGVRARSVGLYHLVRSITIAPSAAIGRLLWKLSPQVPFVTAGIIGFVGTVVYAATVEERYAS